MGDADAIVQGERRLCWRDYEARAARLAGAFAGAGLQPGSKVATFLYNCPELLEARFAALKQRAVPVNVNYRYVDSELAYILDNSDSEAVVYHASLAGRIDSVRARLPGVRLWVEVADEGPGLAGALRYEDVLAGATPAPRIRRAEDDIQIIYTGGTTGSPKGVMIAIGNAVRSGLVLATQLGMPAAAFEEAADVAARLAGEGASARNLVACPLMHGTGVQLGANPTMTLGGCTVLMPSRKFDAAEVWSTAAREGATIITLVGDAMAKPLLRALSGQDAQSLRSLRYISSSGAMFSRETKAGLVESLPALTIFDLMSSTEGSLGKSIHTAATGSSTSSFVLNPLARVFDAQDREILPGSPEAGRIAVTGMIPLGYYKDAAKTAQTFREIEGRRWSFPGDFATVAADGSITLLGRGSSVINTGGEKVFAEEVEEAIKRHPMVDDCLVVGIPDERFGECVTALVATLAPVAQQDLIDAARPYLASFKLPRRIVFTRMVPRGANGKADYAEARRLAAAPSPDGAQPPSTPDSQPRRLS